MNTNIIDELKTIEIENERILKQIKNVRESINQLMIQLTYICEESIRIDEAIREINKKIQEEEMVGELQLGIDPVVEKEILMVKHFNRVYTQKKNQWWTCFNFRRTR